MRLSLLPSPCCGSRLSSSKAAQGRGMGRRAGVTRSDHKGLWVHGAGLEQAAAAAAEQQDGCRGRRRQTRTPGQFEGPSRLCVGHASLAAHRFWLGLLRSAASWRLEGRTGEIGWFTDMRSQLAAEQRPKGDRPRVYTGRAGVGGACRRNGRASRCGNSDRMPVRGPEAAPRPPQHAC